MKDRKVFASILFSFLSLASIAQGATPPPPMPPPPPGLPVDGGIVILFLVALSFGIYKTYKMSRKTA